MHKNIEISAVRGSCAVPQNSSGDRLVAQATIYAAIIAAVASLVAVLVTSQLQRAVDEKPNGQGATVTIVIPAHRRLPGTDYL